MSITKSPRSRFWQFEFEHKGQRYRGSTGIEITGDVTKPGNRSRAAAEAYEAGELAKVKKALELERMGIKNLPEISLGEGMSIYAAKCGRAGSRENSVLQRSYKIARIVRDLGATTLVSSLTEGRIKPYLAQLAKDGNRGRGKQKLAVGVPMARATIDQHLAYLNAMIEELRSSYRCPEPYVLKKMRYMKSRDENARLRHLDDNDDEARLIAALEGNRIYDIVMTIMDTGMRKSEAQDLRWPMVEWKGNWHDDSSIAIIKLPKSVTKTDKPRTIPATPRVSLILRRMKATRKATDDDRVFGWRTIEDDTWRPLRKLYYNFQRVIVHAQISDFTIHDLRHHYAVRLARKGVDPWCLQKLLGHARIDMTERYAQFMPADDYLLAAVTKLAA